MDLSDYVVLSTEDLLELQAEACTPATTGERVAGSLQTIAIVSAIGAVVVASSWGRAKAQDWRDNKKARRTVQIYRDTGITV